MAVRKIDFSNGEFYHIFNRGVDKRDIFLDRDDIERFFKSMDEFNVVDPIGSIYENSFNNQINSKIPKQKKLVNFICYCLNPNHFHFVLEQLVDNGISKFMQRIGGYPKYFNLKHKRNGSLFQGKFKAVHISSNEQLLHTSAYVNLNNKVHSLGSKAPKLSSWSEYVDDKDSGFCSKDIILDQFDNKKEYKKLAQDLLVDIKKQREEEKEIENILLE